MKSLAVVLAVILLAKVFVSILFEYRLYFPANFDAAFLTGRSDLFMGHYRYAFYVHIIASPIAILLGTLLVVIGGWPRFRKLHRVAGRVQVILIMAAVVPSGLIMAPNSFAGPITAVGFAGLSIATATTASCAVWYARSKQYALHRRWATRCYILLLSPLLLRIAGGTFIVLAIESELTYRLNAWLSWLIPLAVYECMSFRAQTPQPANRSEVCNGCTVQ